MGLAASDRGLMGPTRIILVGARVKVPLIATVPVLVVAEAGSSIASITGGRP